MQTLEDNAPYVALAAVGLGVLLLVLVLILWRAVRRLRRSQLVILGSSEQRDIVAHVENLDSQVRNQREAVEILTDQLDDHKRQLDRALTNRAIVRYDAFRDAGGEQSASFALLDQYRSGVVFSAIAARDFARIYVKHLRNGVADRDLSPEEQQVVEAAVPRPLKAGERGPVSARASRGEDPQPAASVASAPVPSPAAGPTPHQGGEHEGMPGGRPAVAENAPADPPALPADETPQAPPPQTSRPDPADVFDDLWPPEDGSQRSR